MTWLSIVITLLLEQVHALPARNVIYAGARSLADSAERNLNAGQFRHGVYAWILVVGGLGLSTLVVYELVAAFGWVFALLLNVAGLYLTLGFRQFSHYSTEIQIALSNGNIEAARRALTAWKQLEDSEYSAADLDPQELVRQTVEHGLLLSQRHVFGVFFWCLVLPGPSGAIAYRMAAYLSRKWNRTPSTVTAPDRFGEFARRAFVWMDWIPARLTALGFAIVGDFEGAIYCWRQIAKQPWLDGLPAPSSRTLILVAASGALGQRLMSAPEYASQFADTAEGPGLAEPQIATLRSAVGLVWRAMLLWLLLLLLITIAHVNI